jgi:hypothetical protein
MWPVEPQKVTEPIEKEEKPNVVSIRGEEIIIPHVPMPAVIKMAEGLLEQARSGEICGLAYSAAHHDETYSGWFIGKVSWGMIGSLEGVKLQMVNEYSKD